MRLSTQVRNGIPEDMFITVGQNDEQIRGDTDRALQAGVDYLARLGGGTLKIGPGVYHMRNAIHLSSRIRIVGAGDETVLRKCAGVRTEVVEDSDWYYQSIKVKEPESFNIGDGIVLQSKSPHTGGFQCKRFTVLGKDGDVLHLDKQLVDNFWTDQEPACVSLFPIICGEQVTDIEIRDLVIDGNRTENEFLNGNYVGGVFMLNCDQISIDSITVREYNGDGISWQIVHDLTVTNTRSVNNTGLGLHPGSGSQRPVMTDNFIEGCRIGIFFCWGVKHGLAESNEIVDCELGVSIGHRDTDNTVRKNKVRGSSKHGLIFRNETLPRNGHRNLIEENHFENCGEVDEGVVISIVETEDVVIRRNRFTETRSGAAVTAIGNTGTTRGLVIEDNEFTGLAPGTTLPGVE